MLGLLIVGLCGATANTVVVGLVSAKAHYQKSKLGMITSNPFFDKLDLIDQEEIVLGGWDIIRENAYESAIRNNVHEKKIIEEIREPLSKITPWPAIKSSLDIDDKPSKGQVINELHPRKLIDSIKKDINNFRENNKVDQVIVLNLSSTEKYRELSPDYGSIDGIMDLVDHPKNNTLISSGFMYVIAAIESGCGFIDFTPNLTLTSKGICDLAEKFKVPIAGKDGNTGQTLMKTVIAQMLKLRNLKLEGWYSTNILGNKDGEVLSREEHKKTKMIDKLGVLEPILGYSDFTHIVNIEYYPPRGDNKEAWDNIDFLGWFNRPMQMKISWLGRDSILAAPLIIDLCRLMDFSFNNSLFGIQSQLSLFFKHPIEPCAFDFFSQYEYLKAFYSEYC